MAAEVSQARLLALIRELTLSGRQYQNYLAFSMARIPSDNESEICMRVAQAQYLGGLHLLNKARESCGLDQLKARR